MTDKRFELPFSFVVAALCLMSAGCGDKREQAPSQSALPQAPAAAPFQPPSAPPPESLAPSAPVAPPTLQPIAAGPHVPGVPDLDPEIGATLDEYTKAVSAELNSQAMQAYRKRAYKNAIMLFISALEKDPSNLVHRFNLACTYALDGQVENALAVLRQFQLTPDCPRCFIQLAKTAEDKDFDALRSNPEFVRITAGTPDRLERELKASHWLTFDKEALKNGNVVINADGLPAVSSDGRRIAVLSWRGADGEGGAGAGPVLQIIDTKFLRVVDGQRLLSGTEMAEIDDGTVSIRQIISKLENRIDLAHRRFLGRQWRTMPVQVDRSPDLAACGAPQRFSVGNSTVSFQYPTLTIQNPNGRTLYTATVSDWGPGKEDACGSRTMIADAYVLGEHHILLFGVKHCTGDTCAPPSGSYHAVKLEGD